MKQNAARDHGGEAGMGTLWAPWRMEYILGMKTDACFICNALASGEDEKNLLLHRGERCCVIMNRYPYNNGHLLVAPIRHVADPSQMEDAERLEWMRLTDRALGALRERMHPEGFNIGTNLGRVAGAGLESHLHQHIVPRWNGDTNFMPVVADTKVIPQALDDLYLRLRPYFGR